MSFIKNNFKYILFFLIFLSFLVLCTPVTFDEIWNYGFSYNIYTGLIPYKDFNMVITPLYPFLMSLPFHIFGTNILVFHIFHSILLTFMMYLLYEMYGKKSYFIFIFLLVFIYPVYSSYNSFLIILFVLLLYFEKNNKSDYLIGIVLGFSVLTKQSVGVCLLLSSILYFRQPKKTIKRILGFLLPIFIFVCYLLITNSYKEFLDLCLFGLLDFGKKNYMGFNFFIVIFIFCIIYIIYLIIKDPRNINYYYVLAFSFVVPPIFDDAHLIIFLIVFLLIIIEKIPMQIDKIKIGLVTFIFVSILMIRAYYTNVDGGIWKSSNINNFQYRIVDDDLVENLEYVSKLIDKYQDKEIIFLSAGAYLYKLSNNMEIAYLDLINTGNWGYDGSIKLLKELEKHKDAIFFVEEYYYGSGQQTDEVSLDFIKKNGELIYRGDYGIDIYQIIDKTK